MTEKNTSKYFESEINAKEIVKEIERIRKELGDTKPLLKVCRRCLMNYIDENFETEGTASGEKWQEWSDDWREQRKKLGRGSGKILNLEGELRRSIDSKLKKDELIIGTAKEYAAIHQFGGEIKRKNKITLMPKRPFFRFPENVEDFIIVELHYYVQDLINKQKLKGLE